MWGSQDRKHCQEGSSQCCQMPPRGPKSRKLERPIDVAFRSHWRPLSEQGLWLMGQQREGSGLKSDRGGREADPGRVAQPLLGGRRL